MTATAKARAFWEERIVKAMSMMTDDELARMANNFTLFPGRSSNSP